ncbi:MAG: hypothetical protein M3R38_36925 [Actinomycetota bacterium]|nr:hypothetical protein [Actinomycetota bacterium]
MGFEVFDRTKHTRTGFRGSAVPYVKVLRTGRALYLNHLAKDLLGESAHVSFLFDKGRRVAALKSTSPDDPQAVRVSRGRQIGATLFVRHYGIEHGRVCPARAEDGVLVFEVGESSGREEKAPGLA